MKYISQKGSGHSDCFPIAVCNALRFLGIQTPELGTPEWEEILDLSACRTGAVIGEHDVARHLGATLRDISVNEFRTNCPAVISVVNPEMGMYLHAVCLLHSGPAGGAVVNYRVKEGPLVEYLPWGHRGEDPDPHYPSKGEGEPWDKIFPFYPAPRQTPRHYAIDVVPGALPEDPEEIRASGDVICEICGQPYWRHSPAREYLDGDGEPFLRRICTGLIVKL